MNPNPFGNNSRMESTETLALIFKYFSQISKEHDLNVVFITLANLGRDIVNAERCSLWLLDRSKGVINTIVAHGVETLSVSAYYGIVGHAIKTGEELMTNDPYADPRFYQLIDNETGYKTKCIIVIPIKNDDDEVIGAFQALNKLTEPHVFTQEDVERLRMVASYSGKSIENAQLHSEMEQTQKEVINLLSEAAESRSLETGNHIKRVVKYSKVVAIQMGLSESEIELLELASPMHDVGKVGIPDSVLQKPGSLTPDEFEIMKTHCEIGYKILNRSKRPIIAMAATIALQHHERFDGKGYPQGLKGDEIHLFARITSICDVFEALSSKRVYKEAWEVEKIFKNIEDEKGRRFAPEIVDAFLACKDEILKIYEEFKD